MNLQDNAIFSVKLFANYRKITYPEYKESFIIWEPQLGLLGGCALSLFFIIRAAIRLSYILAMCPTYLN